MQPEADLGKRTGKGSEEQSSVLRAKCFSLQRDTVIEPGGVRADRDIVVHPGSVVVLPIFEDGRVLLIRQYRHTVGEFLVGACCRAQGTERNSGRRRRAGNCSKKPDTRRSGFASCFTSSPRPVL